MTLNTGWRDSFFDGYEQGSLPGNVRRQRTFAAAALICIGFACACMLWTNLTRSSADAAIGPAIDARPAPSEHASAGARALAVAYAYAKLSAGLSDYMRRSAVSLSYAALLDGRHSLGLAPAMFVGNASPQMDGEPAAADVAEESTTAAAPAVAAARPRGGRLARSSAPAPQLELASTGSISPDRMTAGDTPPHKPSIFERLFGKPAPVTLAYAASEDADVGGQGLVGGRYDRFTAVYDISAHTVYLPDGTKLEAHSGLGSRLDDPRHTDERMHGSTPATLYDLEPRESLFHGVRALRLIPVDENKVFGRSGLLAHTFMLGPNGDSNGCVSFRNYNAFLQAYLRHEIKRLAVVARVE